MAVIKKAAESVLEEVQRWGAMRQSGVSLKYMLDFGWEPTQKNLLQSATFLHRELPIRIARRTIELESLPFGLSYKPAVLKVRDWCLDSFRDVRYFPDIRDFNDELAFMEMIKAIRIRHTNVVQTMALCVRQLKKELAPNIMASELDESHQFLDPFCMSRIVIRMLIGQHMALHDPNPQPGVVGQIHSQMSPMVVAQSASEDARAICMREYGTSPDMKIYGDPDFTFPYVL